MTKQGVTRDSVRSAFFSTKPTRKVVKLSSGLEVEVAQPTVGAQLDLVATEDNKLRMLKMFVSNVYLPGTNELVFEAADYDALREQPAAGDYTLIVAALTELMDLGELTKTAKNG